jgi:hypothetical protein
MPDTGEIRKRLLQMIERSRKHAAERRAAVARIQADYETFLDRSALPVFKAMASALKAEGFSFTVHSPAGGVRLASDRSADDYIEIELDSLRRPPAVIGRARYTRGRETRTIDQPLREGVPPSDLADEDVLDFLLTALEPFVER